MGVFDIFYNWFSSNKHTFSREQQCEIERLFDHMRIEVHDGINSANSSTKARLEEMIRMHTTQLNERIDDSKTFCSNELVRMSNELNELKKQLEVDEKKKKMKKSSESEEGKLILEMMKLIMNQQSAKDNNQCPHDPHPPVVSQFDRSFSGPSSPPIPPSNVMPSTSSVGDYTWADNSSHQLRVNGTDEADSTSAGIISSPEAGISYETSRMGRHKMQESDKSSQFALSSGGLANVTNYRKNVPFSKHLSKISHEPGRRFPERFESEHGRIKAKSVSKGQMPNHAGKLILPETRYYKNYNFDYNAPLKNNNNEKLRSRQKESYPRSFVTETSTGLDSYLIQGLPKFRAKINQSGGKFGVDLILPDSRDYNRVNPTLLKTKRIEDEKFENMIEGFMQEFNPTTKSSNPNRDKLIADGVKNFFLNDPSKSRAENGSNKHSSSASVKEWLIKHEKYSENCDDGNESDSSDVSVKTNRSKFSTVSNTSGKRVFWNKPTNYGKPKTYNEPSDDVKSKRFEPKKKYFGYNYTNQSRSRVMRKTVNDSDSRSNNQNWRKCSNVSGSSGMSEIHYPSKEEALKQKIDLEKPLTRELLFLGRTEDGEWITHQPKCLKDIYALEKKYQEYRTIEIS